LRIPIFSLKITPTNINNPNKEVENKRESKLAEVKASLGNIKSLLLVNFFTYLYYYKILNIRQVLLTTYLGTRLLLINKKLSLLMPGTNKESFRRLICNIFLLYTVSFCRLLANL